MAKNPDTFASLVKFIKECNGISCIEPLRVAKVTSLPMLKTSGTHNSFKIEFSQTNDAADQPKRQASKQAVSSSTVDTTLHSHTRRRDFLLMKRTQQASHPCQIHRHKATKTNKTCWRLVETNSYAASRKRPWEAKWNRWIRFAEHWNLLPLPLNVELVKATAACFMTGQYRTPDQYSR